MKFEIDYVGYKRTEEISLTELIWAKLNQR